MQCLEATTVFQLNPVIGWLGAWGRIFTWHDQRESDPHAMFVVAHLSLPVWPDWNFFCLSYLNVSKLKINKELMHSICKGSLNILLSAFKCPKGFIYFYFVKSISTHSSTTRIQGTSSWPEGVTFLPDLLSSSLFFKFYFFSPLCFGSKMHISPFLNFQFEF